MSVPASVQQAVRARAQGRCEYCYSPEWVCAARFTLDHLVPRSRGGTDALHNLALDVHFINTLPVPVASCHSREACPVLDTGAGIQERRARGLDARLRGHDVLLVLDLRNRHLACRRCNERRYTFTTGRDPVTQQESPLFHPVREVWAAHFAWTADGQWIVGQTPTGRATVVRLDLNDERHDDGFIQVSRALWVRGEWHPPATDPVVPATSL